MSANAFETQVIFLLSSGFLTPFRLINNGVPFSSPIDPYACPLYSNETSSLSFATKVNLAISLDSSVVTNIPFSSVKPKLLFELADWTKKTSAFSTLFPLESVTLIIASWPTRIIFVDIFKGATTFKFLGSAEKLLRNNPVVLSCIYSNSPILTRYISTALSVNVLSIGTLILHI